jgi:hypothetical protein
MAITIYGGMATGLHPEMVMSGSREAGRKEIMDGTGSPATGRDDCLNSRPIIIKHQN